MRKIHWIILLSTLGFLILIGSLYLYNLYNVPVLSKEDIQKLSEEAKEQRENITKQTVFEPFEFKKPSKNKNVYFGDLHVHSSLSFDSYIFGNRYGLEETYNFAKGEPMQNMFGETMQISRPLDFAAVTDHAETFGLQESCADPEITDESRLTCERLESPSYRFFIGLRDTSVARPPVSIMMSLENLQLSLHTNIHLHYLMVDTITGTLYLKIIQFQKKLIRCLMHIQPLICGKN